MDQYSDPNAPINFDDLFGPQIYNPALGLTLAKNPEVLAMHFAASGQPPPTENLPPIPVANPSTTQHTIEPKDASEAPSGLDQPWTPKPPPDPNWRRAKVGPQPSGAASAEEGRTDPGVYGSPTNPPADPTAAYGTPPGSGSWWDSRNWTNPEWVKRLLPGGPASANANPVEGSAPGSPAPGLPPAVDVGARPVAPPAVSGPLDIMPPGASAPKPPVQSRLADALAALKALTPPAPPRISSPAAPHPTGHIPPSQILQLVQSLSGGGQLGPQRTLGELLAGR